MTALSWRSPRMPSRAPSVFSNGSSSVAEYLEDEFIPGSFSPSPTASEVEAWAPHEQTLESPRTETPLCDIIISEDFWFSDGTVVIKVDGTLYNIYKGVLVRQSDFIRLKLDPPPPPTPKPGGKKRKGKLFILHQLAMANVQVGTFNDPLVLDVAKSDFEILLSYMFPLDYAAQYEFALKEWSAIASVAIKLELNSITLIAISNILKIASPVDLIEIGRKHIIPQLYIEGFRLLCHREESLSLREGEILGLACVIHIARARDMLAKGALWSELDFSTEFDVSA